MKKSFEPLTTPILFIVFNRPDVTRQVFEAIRQVQPLQLFVAADGPRPHKPEDAAQCQAVRDITTQVDCDCDVQTLFREENLGCKRAVSGAIDWFFEQVAEGIILEDDCLPNQSFFYYCQETLARYRKDTRVVHINGNNYNAAEFASTPFSYHFTYFSQVWGWATWRRAWQRYDVDMKLFPQFDSASFFQHAVSPASFQVLRKKWMEVHEGRMDTWDYQWHFINLLEGALTVAPRHNLIANLGFQEGATHTLTADPTRENLPTKELSFPLNFPPCLFIDESINAHYRRMMKINKSPFTARIKRKLRTLV